jgi:hypothetical protein
MRRDGIDMYVEQRRCRTTAQQQQSEKRMMKCYCSCGNMKAWETFCAYSQSGNHTPHRWRHVNLVGSGHTNIRCGANISYLRLRGHGLDSRASAQPSDCTSDRSMHYLWFLFDSPVCVANPDCLLGHVKNGVGDSHPECSGSKSIIGSFASPIDMQSP